MWCGVVVGVWCGVVECRCICGLVPRFDVSLNFANDSHLARNLKAGGPALERQEREHPLSVNCW